MELEFFFDTYAIFEIINNNPKYLSYNKCKIVLSKLNLYEIYNSSRKKGFSVMESQNLFNKFINKETEIKYEDLIMASELKLIHKNISIPDAIGYCIANRLKIKFLTGDKEFENMQNVEFVKK